MISRSPWSRCASTRTRMRTHAGAGERAGKRVHARARIFELKWLFLLDLSMVDRRLHDDLRKIYLLLKAPRFDLHRQGDAYTHVHARTFGQENAYTHAYTPACVVCVCARTRACTPCSFFARAGKEACRHVYACVSLVSHHVTIYTRYIHIMYTLFARHMRDTLPNDVRYIRDARMM
jgi:hypothetical protein